MTVEPTDGSFWADADRVAPSRLSEAAAELHWAVQLIASAGQTFAEPRDDDSHRAMMWDPALRALVGAPFAGPYPFRVAVRPADLTLELVDRTGEALGSLPLGGVTIENALEWLALGVATYQGTPPPTIERPDYDMPSHRVGAGAPFDAEPSPELEALADLYGASAEMLGLLVSTVEDASPIRCWPHHFDIATLITLARDAEGAAAKTVGVGMAPFGGGYDTWYWYVTPWPYPDASSLPEFVGPGGWRTEGWTGLVLTGDDLAAMPAPFREPALRKFLDVGVEAAREALGR